jgi:tetratricopeptide (TPR) repeat protein
MGWRVWLRDRPLLKVGLATAFGLAVLGCAGTEGPEKPENDGNPANHLPGPTSGTPSTATPPAALVQTATELEHRAEEAEKKIGPLRREAESDPSNAQKQHALGRALFDANFKEQAIVHLERAAELDPSVRMLLDLAVGYAAGARLDDAEREYERLLKLSPDFSIAFHNLGVLAHRRGEFDAAVGYFNRALEKEPNYLLARLHLGDSLNASGRFQDAYRSYEQVLGLEPSNPQEANGYVEALYKLASLDLKMGAHERAGQFLTELIRMAPDHNKAYYAYGQVLLYMGYPEEAQKAFDKHVQILAAEEPKSAVAMGD